MKITRREFVKGGISTFTIGFIAPALLTDMARAGNATDRNLIVLNLDGGIDGLSVLIPYKDPFYFSRRPTISLPAEQVLPIGSDAANIPLGLHPRLTGLKALYDKGRVAFIQRTGYENSSRSHFLGGDIVSTGDLTNSTRFGWLGRYLDSVSAETLYAWNTTSSTPRIMLAPIYQVPAIPSVAAYSYRTNNGSTEGAMEKAKALKIASHVPVDRPHVALVQKSMSEALATVDRVQTVNSYTPSTGVTYPNNGFGNALKMIAGAIVKNLGTKIFFIRLGGFDTHAAMQTRQGYFFNLMVTLNDGLNAFIQDLTNQGAFANTLIMSYSEFGRRLTENASGGNDHGGGNTTILLGGSLRGGIYGTSPDLNPYPGNPTLESNGGDVHYETDFRSVYALIADDWLGADSVSLLDGNFRNAKLKLV